MSRFDLPKLVNAARIANPLIAPRSNSPSDEEDLELIQPTPFPNTLDDDDDSPAVQESSDVKKAEATSSTRAVKKPQTLNAFAESRIHKENAATPSMDPLSLGDEYVDEDEEVNTKASFTSRTRRSKATARSAPTAKSRKSKPSLKRRRKNSEVESEPDLPDEETEDEDFEGSRRRAAKSRPSRTSSKRDSVATATKSDRVLRTRGSKPTYAEG